MIQAADKLRRKTAHDLLLKIGGIDQNNLLPYTKDRG